MYVKSVPLAIALNETYEIKLPYAFRDQRMSGTEIIAIKAQR
jgi:hypothetical protein